MSKQDKVCLFENWVHVSFCKLHCWQKVIREVFWLLTWLVLLIVCCPYCPRGPPEERSIIVDIMLKYKQHQENLISGSFWSENDLLPPWLGRFAILSAVFQSGKPRTTFWCLAHEICQSRINDKWLMINYWPTRSVNFAIWSWVLLNPKVKQKLPWTMLGLMPSCICSQLKFLHPSLSEIHSCVKEYHQVPYSHVVVWQCIGWAQIVGGRIRRFPNWAENCDKPEME